MMNEVFFFEHVFIWGFLLCQLLFGNADGHVTAQYICSCLKILKEMRILCIMFFLLIFLIFFDRSTSGRTFQGTGHVSSPSQ